MDYRENAATALYELQAFSHGRRCCTLFNRKLNIPNVMKYKFNILLWIPQSFCLVFEWFEFELYTGSLVSMESY